METDTLILMAVLSMEAEIEEIEPSIDFEDLR